MLQWEDSLAPVREVLTGDGLGYLWWEMPIPATAPALSCWGCYKACELNLFSSSGKVGQEEDLAAAENVSFFQGRIRKIKKGRPLLVQIMQKNLTLLKPASLAHS